MVHRVFLCYALLIGLRLVTANKRAPAVGGFVEKVKS
jgi:hypothetical protein